MAVDRSPREHRVGERIAVVQKWILHGRSKFRVDGEEVREVVHAQRGVLHLAEPRRPVPCRLSEARDADEHGHAWQSRAHQAIKQAGAQELSVGYCMSCVLDLLSIVRPEGSPWFPLSVNNGFARAKSIKRAAAGGCSEEGRRVMGNIGVRALLLCF